MDKSDRIYVAPKRGRLPRKYERVGASRGDRWLLVCIGIVALALAFWLLIITR